MTSFASNITAIFSLVTLVSHVVLVVALIALLTKRPVAHKISQHAVLIGFLISFASVLGSLIYSNIIGFEACELCWWQRIFLYPQAVLFAVALYREKKHKIEDSAVFAYSITLSIVGGAVALFHYYGQMFNPSLLDACLAQGASCSKLFFVSFGYITIPMMSLTAYLFLILLYFFRKK